MQNWFDPVALSDRVGQDRLATAETEHALVTKLHCIISPFMLRRTKSETSLVLPPKRELLLRVGMTEIQKDLYEQARSLCFKNIQYESLSNQSSRNSIRNAKCGGSITWLDPANIIPDPNASATGKNTSPRPTTRLYCFLSRMSMGTKTSSMTTGQRMTRSKTSSASQPSVSTASSECDKDIQVLGEKRQKYTISHLVNLNNGLMVLRQIANHPYLVMDFRDRESDSALDSAHLLPTCGTDLIFASEKTKLLDRLLTVLINTKHKVSMMKLN
ncbi:Lymphoid-specific helicase [Fasciolopsis buskii]|uniref:Lymphoid-specific helicase n=1 Tax=Fasciolopsis buskii TaxID=27845 RepID=A0A8E0VJI4_9TREM|nr:Lymphoid-specific helicase [Fasciolopsis buski]